MDDLLLNALSACLDQLEEYSENEYVIGETHEFTIVELRQLIQDRTKEYS